MGLGRRAGSSKPTRRFQGCSTPTPLVAERSKRSLRMISASPSPPSACLARPPARRSPTTSVKTGVTKISKKGWLRYKRWRALQERGRSSARGNRWCSETKTDQERTRTSWWTRVGFILVFKLPNIQS